MTFSSDADVILLTENGPQHMTTGEEISMLDVGIEGGYISGRCEECDSIVLMYGDFEQSYVDQSQSMGPEIGYRIRHYTYCDHCNSDLFLNSEFREYPRGMLRFLQVESEGAVYHNIDHVESMISSVTAGQSSVEDVFHSFTDLETFFESDPQRPLASALRDLRQASKESVLVLGNFDEPHKDELEDIRDELNSNGYDAYVAENLEARTEDSVDRFVALLMAMTSFCVMVDRSASGHVAEYKHAHKERHILARLEPTGRGRPSTAMIGSEEREVDYMKKFPFDDSPSDVIGDAVQWAESIIETRAKDNKSQFPWY